MHANMTLTEFTKDWFIFNRCPYIQGKIRRGGHFSQSVADSKRQQLEDYILPQFGKKRLDEISSEGIEGWLFMLQDKGLSNSTINHFYATLRLILKEAERKQLITDNPINRVPPFINNPKEKGTITQEESNQLFQGKALSEVWRNHFLHYMINRTASLSGMRLGEIQALRREALQKDYIVVSRSWDRKYGEKETKTGITRHVPVPADLIRALGELADRQSSGPYLFSSSDGKTPIHHRIIYQHFYAALVKIGIDPEERKKRNITFHSWRHYFNSLLRLQGVPDHITQLIIGHSNDRMTNHYTHLHPQELSQAMAERITSLEIQVPQDL